ncbi:hypothetical protein TVAG_384030 [Trichomonas vaginalis G3]|uniref:Uncharacterized protein n=1 Tax=Trichomonas vaginalis (strain ATCC PRA-98 / G3) TaxID=412133 RepID=A2F0A2_TRIV3|nr:ankycorbin family [Trichomonas vaginalis G3]EAY01664.1 hypothetical protein TVAG_384030 [Trichomonas vaginalis G3]KAI5515706.1 ankycorbin family [Trichomonas vaginalis G3]|eukprot:XP_001314257.1 hypothetical protein [Trichomonas vaginalis G3]
MDPSFQGPMSVVPRSVPYLSRMNIYQNTIANRTDLVDFDPTASLIFRLGIYNVLSLYDTKNTSSQTSQTENNIGLNSPNGLTFYPPEDIMNTELPKSLELINEVQQMFLNYDRNNEEQTRKLVDFIENHVYTGLRELSTNIFLRPQKVKDYVHLYSLLSRNIKIISCHNFACTPIFSHYLIKEGICSEFEAKQLSARLPNQSDMFYQLSSMLGYSSTEFMSNPEAFPNFYLKEYSELIKGANCHDPSPKELDIINIFIEDNIEELVKISSQPDFHYDTKVFNSNISLINLSAMYGAINCFKYLLVHNPDLEIFVIMLLLVVTQKSSVFLNKQVLISMIHQLLHYSSVVMNYLTGFVPKQPKKSIKIKTKIRTYFQTKEYFPAKMIYTVLLKRLLSEQFIH